MTTQHTPPPWEFDWDDQLITHKGASIAFVNSADDFPCADQEEWRKIDAQQQANGEHIVRCVNEHDALVAKATLLRDLVNVCNRAVIPHLQDCADLGSREQRAMTVDVLFALRLVLTEASK